MTTRTKNGKRLPTQQSVNSAVWAICDIMRRSNCAGALQYVPELTWILFLRILDEREAREADEAEALGVPFTRSLQAPYRWHDWAAPESAMRQDKNASVWKFVHESLLPQLKALESKPGATPRQKVVSEIMSSVDRSRHEAKDRDAGQSTRMAGALSRPHWRNLRHRPAPRHGEGARDCQGHVEEERAPAFVR